LKDIFSRDKEAVWSNKSFGPWSNYKRDRQQSNYLCLQYRFRW